MTNSRKECASDHCGRSSAQLELVPANSLIQVAPNSKYPPPIVKNWEVTFTFAQQKKINIKIKTIDSSPEIHTPNLDELAATSAVFNRAYVQVVHRSLCTYKQASTEAYMPMCRQVQKYKHTSSISIRSTYSVVNESYWFFKLSKHAGWDSLVLDRIKRKWKYVFAKDI